jgi:KipI family sensor histidine kinase inhibitor
MSPRFLDAGEAALVVEFGAAVDPAIHDRVLALDDALTALALPGIRETAPTYRSLIIHYDPLALRRESLVDAVRDLVRTPFPARRAAIRWNIPCCYEPPFGEDIVQVAQTTGLTPEAVISMHAGAIYRVYMYGFAPGFCYLGGVPPALAVSRRATPRPPTPPNVVVLGGGLTLISTISMPTGWWILGRTPERMFSLTRRPPFLAEAGDELRFLPIARAEFEILELRARRGEVIATREQLR